MSETPRVAAAPLFVAIPMADIDADPDQPRKAFTPAELEELAASIREHGLLQPILVRPFGNRFRIVAGERRWRAHQHNGAVDIMCQVRSDLSDADILNAQIIENIQRQPMSPLEEAVAYQRAVDRNGGDIALTAKRLGMKQAWRITERTCLLRLDDDYRRLFATGNLSNSEAFEIAQLEPGAQQRRLFDAVRRGLCPNYKALRAARQAIAAQAMQADMFGAAAPRPTAEEQAHLTALEKRIGRAALYADKLALIRRHVQDLENALRAGAALRADLLDTAAA
jgi:ParB family chromosome partitioning protein